MVRVNPTVRFGVRDRVRVKGIQSIVYERTIFISFSSWYWIQKGLFKSLISKNLKSS